MKTIAPLALVLCVFWLGGPALAQDLDMKAEVSAAVTALDDASRQLGGMGGLGAIPEDDLQAIQGILGEGERLIRESRRRSQDAKSPQEEAWAVAYARAGKAMVEAANAYKQARGHN